MFQDGTQFASLLFECMHPENNIIPKNTSLSKQNSAFTLKTYLYDLSCYEKQPDGNKKDISTYLQYNPDQGWETFSRMERK